MRPLDPRWLDAIDAVAADVLGRRDRTGEALVAEVAALSHVYTRGRDRLATQGEPLAARLRFFLPRDLPKIEGPLGELASAGCLPGAARWRVLDLGAGLGTTTLGVAGFARRHGVTGVDVVAVERDARSLDVGRALAARCGTGALGDVAVPVRWTDRSDDLTGTPPAALGGPYDLIVVGLALNELWPGAPDRIRRRAAWLAALRPLLADDGALIVIEPALRAVTRDLMAVRDVLQARGIPVFAPCTHDGPCPLLARERDWCHEEAPVALPDRLVPIARGAGLRWARLTWAALVIRRDGRRRSDAWRVVGGPIKTKGRTEWHACGEGGTCRIARLDRHRGDADPLDDVRRGALLDIAPPPTDGATVRTDRTRVTPVG